MRKIFALMAISLAFCLSASAQAQLSDVEPNVELARLWWPEQRNVWTPISWQDHYFKFTVMYNGQLIADPAPGFSPRPHSRKWEGQSFLLTFRATEAGTPKPLPSERLSLWKIDGGQGIQGWVKGHETPVLWTEYRCQEGVVLRTEVFSHITSNADIVTALEPLFAWVRVKVVHVDPLRHPQTIPMSVQLSRSYLDHGEHYEYAVAVDAVPEKAPYPKELVAVPYTDNGLVGQRIVEPDGKVRLDVLPTDDGRVSLEQVSQGIYNLKLIMNCREGDYVDMLLPMLPETRETVDAEKALTYDGALTCSDWYWNDRPATAATFHVPEHFINEALEQSIKFSKIINERDYETLEYSYLTGIWGYDALWTTPTSMVSHMLMDQMGYFDQTAKYTEVFYKNQGTVVPPGPAYYLHPGYFSTHKILTSIDWLSDHGALMHQIATHALLTDDKEFISHWTEPLVKACDFIKDMSAVKGHGGVEGLLPPAVATDDMIPMQAVWNIAWNYKGLKTTVRLLEMISHPRAAEIKAFCEEFRETFLREYRKTVAEGLTWTDSQGRTRYRPSTVMTNEQPRLHPYTEAFYLDTGPMVLVWAGLMDADDPIMRDCADFFREGPDVRLWETMPHAIDRGVLFHEMSSCEPCYSWNNFHSWQLGDRRRYLEGMYSILVGAISQNTYISCEHRHGIQGNLFAFPMGFYLAKLSVIDDQISCGDLHLLRLCPLAWLRADEEAVFENMPTELGTVNLRFRLSDDSKTLIVKFDAAWKHAHGDVILHVPPVPGLEKVNVNGVEYSGQTEIRL